MYACTPNCNVCLFDFGVRWTLSHVGALCNSQCPDELSLGELTSNNWHIGVKLAIAALINIVALFCVAMKLSFMFWLRQLEKKQRLYLESLDDELESTDEATLPVNM